MSGVRYFSACSGIEAATVAWGPLGWSPVGYSEVDPFCCAVLAQRYPYVSNYGDITRHTGWDLPEDIHVMVAGTPCQSYSTAGLRGGLEDPRGQLALNYLDVVERSRPRWVVWENVPGVRTCEGGRAFSLFTGRLTGMGYAVEWAVLDAAAWLPLRRRRVFVVARDLRAGPDAAAAVRWVLEPADRLSAVAETRYEAAKRPARDAPDVPIGFCPQEGRSFVALHGMIPAITANQRPAVMQDGHVRWLTVPECLRLMGFPADYLDIRFRGRPAPDSRKYRAIGNSIGVPVLAWLGRRIAAVDAAMGGAFGASPGRASQPTLEHAGRSCGQA